MTDVNTAVNVDADYIRELVRRGEGVRIEFKSVFPSENGKFAKQLCAMANALTPGTAPGFILIGVQERASAVLPSGDAPDVLISGVPPASHLDEADYRNKVASLLNRVPSFTFRVVDVDGMSVGVFQVLPGKRPYFAVLSRGGLARNVAYVRNGAGCDEATPEQIYEWAREDGRLSIEEMQMRAQQTIIARAQPAGSGFNGDDVVLGCAIENHGETAFRVTRAEAMWRLTKSFCLYCRAHGVDANENSMHGTAEILRAHAPPGASAMVNAATRLDGRLVDMWNRYRQSQQTVTPMQAHLRMELNNSYRGVELIEATLSWPPRA